MTTRWPRPSAGLALASLIATATLTGTPGFARQTQGQPNVADVEVRVWPVQGNVYLAVGGFANAAFSVGEDGVLVVDTLVEPLADKFIAEIRKVAGDKPIRYVINTHVHGDHTGGNVKVAAAGQSVAGGTFAGQVGPPANAAFIWAHENVHETDERATARSARDAVRRVADRHVLHRGEGAVLQRRGRAGAAPAGGAHRRRLDRVLPQVGCRRRGRRCS